MKSTILKIIVYGLILPSHGNDNLEDSFFFWNSCLLPNLPRGEQLRFGLAYTRRVGWTKTVFYHRWK